MINACFPALSPPPQIRVPPPAASAGGPAQVQELRLLLRERYAQLVGIFEYFSAASSGDPFAMHANAWAALMAAGGVADEAPGSSCRTADLGRIFISANFEEDRKTPDAKVGWLASVGRLIDRSVG